MNVTVSGIESFYAILFLGRCVRPSLQLRKALCCNEFGVEGTGVGVNEAL